MFNEETIDSRFPAPFCVNHKTEFNIESETSDGIECNDNTYDNATSTKRVQSSNMAVSRAVEHVSLFLYTCAKRTPQVNSIAVRLGC